MNQVLILALIGGLISAGSTSLGAFLTPYFQREDKIQRFRLSIDFALGIMLSTVAFSLVGPELIDSWGNTQRLNIVVIGFIVGVAFIWLTHQFTDYLKPQNTISSGRIVLALALVFHNFPEGMGAGASLAGMELRQAIPLQVAIAIQNVAEGLLLALCFLSFGWSLRKSILGSVGSGLVEFTGALIAGLLLQQTMAWLPFFLSVAGGAMLVSVLIELREAKSEGRLLDRAQFLLGLLLIPLINLVLNF